MRYFQYVQLIEIEGVAARLSARLSFLAWSSLHDLSDAHKSVVHVNGHNATARFSTAYQESTQYLVLKKMCASDSCMTGVDFIL